MSDFFIHQQKHGYRNGHQLLEGTIRLDRPDQDTIDRLSDISGPIRPGEVIPCYLTIYPLPSRNFHVIARTWPDLKAPRAGCVLTRSLLVPAELWNKNPYLSWSLEQLTSSTASELQPILYEPVDQPLPPVDDARTLELVEALFLEIRKPIVVFEAMDPDLLAIRLLTAFWPAFRSEFSVCTHALAPRKIGGREFDLVFASKSARSRFSAWPGRKIDIGAPRNARHRWSPAVAEAVFMSPDPTLASGDALGLLGADGPADEAAFRKSLLWNELAEKALRNPSAVLGMLDIVNSQSGLASSAMKSSQQLLTSAIGSAVDGMSPAEAWGFLRTLEGKIQGRGELMMLGHETALEAARLAAADPHQAVEFAAGYEHEPDVQSDLIRGLADGLGNAVHDIPIDFRRIPPLVGAFMIASSSAFTAAAARRIRAGEASASDLSPYFLKNAGSWVDKACERLVTEIDGREFAPLLANILRASSEEHLVERIVDVVRRTKLAFPEFDDVLSGEIPDDAGLRKVRSVVTDEIAPPDADRFLARTIRLAQADIDWLFNSALEPSRAAGLLSAVLTDQGDRSITEARDYPSIRPKMLQILAWDMKNTAPQIARMLALGHVSARDLFEYGLPIIDELSDSLTRLSLVNLVVKRALFEADVDDSRVEPLISEHFDEVGARQVVRWCTGDGLSTGRVASNLKILIGLSEVRQKEIANFVESLSDDLTRRGPPGLDADICSAWARLLWDARFTAPFAHIKAATKTVATLIHFIRSPVAEVIAASFPSVYRELVSRNRSDNDGVLGLLFSLPLMLVSDWDRAKPARHGLVDAFMGSEWPPSYLLLAAERAGILDRICLRVSRQRGGGKYLTKAIADLDRLTPDQAASIRMGIDEFGASDMGNEWD